MTMNTAHASRYTATTRWEDGGEEGKERLASKHLADNTMSRQVQGKGMDDAEHVEAVIMAVHYNRVHIMHATHQQQQHHNALNILPFSTKIKITTGVIILRFTRAAPTWQ